MTAGGNSRPVFSKQSTIHDRLETVVKRHMGSPYLKPPPEHTKQAFTRVCDLMSLQRKILILDSGCGTGESSLHLAATHPDHWIIGLDKSAVRLAKAVNKKIPDNLLFIRPAFSDLLQISHNLVLRSNWRIYVEEFAAALRFVTGSVGEINQIHPHSVVSLFEKKYLASGFDLYELRVCLISAGERSW